MIALAYSVLYYVLGLIEKATSGWGMNGQLFALGWIAGEQRAVQILFYFVLVLSLHDRILVRHRVHALEGHRHVGCRDPSRPCTGRSLIAVAYLWQRILDGLLGLGGKRHGHRAHSVGGWSVLFPFGGRSSYLTLRRATP